MTGEIAARPPKAIPPARDRLQSRILVWTVMPLLFLLSVGRTIGLSVTVPHLRPYIAESVGASLCFGLLAWRSKAATAAAAASGSVICLCLLYLTSTHSELLTRSALLPLVTLFVLTFVATRAGRARKAAVGLAESRGGRTVSQVVANLGFAPLLVFPLMFVMLYWGWPGTDSGEQSGVIVVAVLAAIAEAAADTVSSEIGHAFGGQPILLTTLRRVPPGTDGAISLIGTLAGIAAAAIIATTGAPAMHLTTIECVIAFAAGVLGLFFDSLLGATLERRGWIGNDLVNFASTAFAAAVSLIAMRELWTNLSLWLLTTHN
jgi:uncharacterized protein (TIGR00297 family)